MRAVSQPKGQKTGAVFGLHGSAKNIFKAEKGG